MENHIVPDYLIQFLFSTTTPKNVIQPNYNIM